MKIIAVTNIKGGVGKTTTAVNLAYLCAHAGAPTVLRDLDAQAAATYLLEGDGTNPMPAGKLVSGKRDVSNAISQTRYAHLDLIAADISYRNLDVRLSEHKRPVERLLRMSRSLRSTYAALFLDCHREYRSCRRTFFAPPMRSWCR